MLTAKGGPPTKLPPQMDPRQNPTLGDVEEALIYNRINPAPQPVVCMTGDIDRYQPANQKFVYEYEMVPRGLVYVLAQRDHYGNDPAEHVALGLGLWRGDDSQAPLNTAGMASRPVEKWPRGMRTLVRRASKLSNDFGVYCHRYGDDKDAIDLYMQARRFYTDNYAALLNLKIAGAQVDFNLSEEISIARLKFNNDVETYLKKLLGKGAPEETWKQYQRYFTAYHLIGSYGLVRDMEVVADFSQANPNDRARTFEFRYGIISLGVLVDPEGGNKVLAERGGLCLIMLGQRASVAQLVRALQDLRSAEPFLAGTNLAKLFYQIGEVQARLRNAKGAEAAFKKGIEVAPEYGPLYSRLADVYASSKRVDEAIQLLKDRMRQQPPATTAELVSYLQRLKKYFKLKEDAAGFDACAEDYARKAPNHALDTKMFLLDSALGDKNYDRARELAREIGADYANPPALQARVATIAFAEERYKDILNMDELPPGDAVTAGDRMRWHRIRSDALLQQGQATQALRELKRAFDIAMVQADGIADEASKKRAVQNVQATFTPGLSFAALQAAAKANDPELEREALSYAQMYMMLSQRSSMSEPNKMLASAYFGWTLFKLRGDAEKAVSLIEPAVLGVPSAGTPKYYLGAVLIEQGEVERGLALVTESIEGQIGSIDKAEAEALLAKHKGAGAPSGNNGAEGPSTN